MYSDRTAKFQFVPAALGGELRFAWNGHQPEARVYFAGAEQPHATVDVSDLYHGDREEFERECTRWVFTAEPKDLGRPFNADSPILIEEANHLLRLGPNELRDKERLRLALGQYRRRQMQADREHELALDELRKALL